MKPSPLDTYSPQQLRAVIKAIWRYRAVVDGYQPWGYDWRTLYLTNPHTVRVLRECMRRLPADYRHVGRGKFVMA